MARVFVEKNLTRNVMDTHRSELKDGKRLLGSCLCWIGLCLLGDQDFMRHI